MKPKLIVSKLDDKITFTALNEESLEFVLNRCIPSGSDYVCIYDDLNLSIGFEFCYDFNFNDENGSTAIPSFNVEKGKELIIGLMRNRRNKMFPELDIQYMRALESGNQTLIQEIVAKKQALRDVTEIDFSDCVTPEDVKAKWPTELLGNSPYQTI